MDRCVCTEVPTPRSYGTTARTPSFRHKAEDNATVPLDKGDQGDQGDPTAIRPVLPLDEGGQIAMQPPLQPWLL